MYVHVHVMRHYFQMLLIHVCDLAPQNGQKVTRFMYMYNLLVPVQPFKGKIQLLKGTCMVTQLHVLHVHVHVQPLSHRRSVASLCLFYRYFHGSCATSVSDLVPPVRVFERETRLSACSYPYTLCTCRTKSHSNSFCPRTA